MLALSNSRVTAYQCRLYMHYLTFNDLRSTVESATWITFVETRPRTIILPDLIPRFHYPCVWEWITVYWLCKTSSNVNWPQIGITLFNLQVRDSRVVITLKTWYTHYCRALQDKCSKLKSALKEYTSWQTLSPHEALSKVNTVRSSLQRASGTTLHVDTPSKLSNITFEMPDFKMLSSLEHLGRLKVEGSAPMAAAITTLPNGSAKHKSLVGDDEPPAKKRKEVWFNYLHKIHKLWTHCIFSHVNTIVLLLSVVNYFQYTRPLPSTSRGAAVHLECSPQHCRGFHTPVSEWTLMYAIIILELQITYLSIAEPNRRL